MVASYTLDLAVIQANAVLAAVALLTSIYAAIHASPAKRPYYAAVATLALVYTVSHILLLGDFPARLVLWGQIMRGVAMVVWILVWIIPSILDVQEERRKRKLVTALVEAVTRKLGDKT